MNIEYEINFLICKYNKRIIRGRLFLKIIGMILWSKYNNYNLIYIGVSVNHVRK